MDITLLAGEQGLSNMVSWVHMIETKEAIEIIEVERACVKRNTDNKCDRDCINCDLLRTEEEIFAAYDMAIESLEKRIPKKTNKVMDRTWGTKEELDVELEKQKVVNSRFGYTQFGKEHKKVTYKETEDGWLEVDKVEIEK